jgi:hypothetical protein
MRYRYSNFSLLAKTICCRLFGRTDIQRWGNLQNFDTAWDERTKLMARLIPKGSRVIEFGAGRRRMELFLDPTCKYFPSDLVSRGSNTIICDFNAKPLPNLKSLNLDVAVFGGVLEYVSDLYSIPLWLSQYVDICILSYECANSKQKTFSRAIENISRALIGWSNTYSEEELKNMFRAGGFFCSEKLVWKTKDGDEQIFMFQKSKSIRI